MDGAVVNKVRLVEAKRNFARLLQCIIHLGQG